MCVEILKYTNNTATAFRKPPTEIVPDLRKYAFILASVVTEEESWPGHQIQCPLVYREGPQSRSLYCIWTVVGVNPNSSHFDSCQQRMIVLNTSVTHIAI